MRTLRITSENMHFFEQYFTEEERRRLENGKMTALGAVAGVSPCAALLFTVEAREAYLKKIYVEEGFRRCGVATGLLEQVEKTCPGLYKIECSYQENGWPAFDQFLKHRRDFFFEGGSTPVYVVGKEEADSIKLPGENGKISEFFGMGEYAVHRFLQNIMRKNGEEINALLDGHIWVKEACLCHRAGADIDACFLTERPAEGGVRLYYAFSGKDGAPAFLTCLRRILRMVRDGIFPAYEIVCRTERSRKVFEKLLSGREPDGYLVTALKYI